MFIQNSRFLHTLRLTKSKLCKSGNTKKIIQAIRKASDQGGDIVSPSYLTGIERIRNPRFNKGLAFTIEERLALGIHGLQPGQVRTQEEQLEICKFTVNNYKIPLNKYIYLTELRDRHEQLFFRLLREEIQSLLPIVYTPTVGLACQQFGVIYHRPHGLFISINDKGHIYDILRNWPEPFVSAIVVTDGERILGLGDLGSYGMGIPIGKLALYTALAGVKPYHCLPICLDVGTENETLLQDPVYVGLRQKRVRGKEYDEFLDEFMAAVVRRYGQDTLIQFEDFGTLNAARLLAKYRDQYCTFNDDIQGTAAVALAAVIAANKILNKQLSDHTIMFLGAGTASVGIAELLVEAMMLNGTSKEEARSKICMVDIEGLVTTSRKKTIGNVMDFAKDHSPEKDLVKLIDEFKPSILLGASTKGGAFTPEVLKAMATHNERPIVFALSNPTNKAECTPEQAYQHTDGRVIYASGSPFGPFEYSGKTINTTQGNNAYIFPGVALGVISGMIHHIPERYFIIAAHTVAENVSEEDLCNGKLLPPLECIVEVSLRIAEKILTEAYSHGEATYYPEPKNKRKFIETQLYDYNYSSALNATWTWPKSDKLRTKTPGVNKKC